MLFFFSSNLCKSSLLMKKPTTQISPLVLIYKSQGFSLQPLSHVPTRTANSSGGHFRHHSFLVTHYTGNIIFLQRPKPRRSIASCCPTSSHMLLIDPYAPSPVSRISLHLDHACRCAVRPIWCYPWCPHAQSGLPCQHHININAN